MRNFSKRRVEQAIKGSGGLIATVAKKLGCKWETANGYIKKYELQNLIEDERETMLDLAESKLLSNIQKGDNASIFFYLKTQGKKRGYIERSEVTGKDGSSLLPSIEEIDISDLSNDEQGMLLKIARKFEYK